MKKFRIKHIFHSGFEIQFEDYIILIDVFNHLEAYEGKKIYCFSTHSHGDHFSPDMFKLRSRNEVQYVFSDDIQAEGQDITFVKDGDELRVDHMAIKVFGTTDLGVSYYIKIGDTVFFHSGDLNWWHWANDSEATQNDEKNQYQSEIKRIKGLPVDFAFVPVDARLGDANRYAMDYFINTIKPKYLIPMHFGDQFHSIDNIETDSDTQLLKSKTIQSFIY